MKRFLIGALALVAASLLSGPAVAQGNSCSGGAIPGMVVGGASAGGACYYIKVNSDGSINTTASAPGTDQDVNLVGINGVAPVTGQGSDTAALRVVANSPIGTTPTDRTITSATGASQTVMAANAARHSLIIQNTGSANCGVNPTGGTAVIGGAGTLTLFPGGSYQPRIPTLSAVTAICTAAQPLYAEEN